MRIAWLGGVVTAACVSWTAWTVGGATSPHTPHQCAGGLEGFIAVPAGTARIGDDRGYADERPAIAVPLAAFRIARHEVTNREFAAFVAATGHVTTAERRGDSIVFAPPRAGSIAVSPAQWWRIVDGADWRHPEGPGSGIEGREHYPVVHVSLDDAEAYARWKGARLPTEAEFEFAAQGVAGSGPGDGEQPAPDAANTWQGPFPISDLTHDGHAGPAPVGCYLANPLGAHDLIGNVWEWTVTSYRPGHTPGPASTAMIAASAFLAEEDLRVIKGGSFLCAPNYCARYRPAARHAQARQETASHLGFRLAAEP
jgi:formylglycine-generating enzyme required for sulfatase activity